MGHEILVILRASFHRVDIDVVPHSPKLFYCFYNLLLKLHVLKLLHDESNLSRIVQVEMVILNTLLGAFIVLRAYIGYIVKLVVASFGLPLLLVVI